jgi:hypothetical protein
MSWRGRLFGSSPPLHPNSVVIADDVVAALTASGVPLGEAVDATLRSHLEAARRAGEAQARGEKIPFWLGREEGASGEIEDTLRDRISQRRASEEDH